MLPPSLQNSFFIKNQLSSMLKIERFVGFLNGLGLATLNLIWLNLI